MLTNIKNRFNKMIDEIDTSSAISIISSIIVVLTFLFTIVKGQFEKGYSEGLYINNITLSISISSALIQISIPFIISIFFITIFVKQTKDNIPSSLLVFFIKFLYCFQILFVISIIYTCFLVSEGNQVELLLSLISIIIAAIISGIALYFIYKKENTSKFSKKSYTIVAVVVGIIHFTCFLIVFEDLSFSLSLVYFTLIMSLIPVTQMFLRKDTTFNNNVNNSPSRINEFIKKIDSPICMIILTVIIFYVLFAITFAFDLRSIGTNILKEQDLFTKIESNINYNSNSNADGYLLFETTDKKYVAIAYVNDTSDNEIKILKGYKFIDIDNLEVTEQKFNPNNINK